MVAALKNEHFVLIVQTGDEGECLVSASWAEALGEKPDYIVDVATRKETREIFERIAAVRWTLVEHDTLFGLWRLCQVVRRAHYDLCIDLSARISGKLLARASRARQAVRPSVTPQRNAIDCTDQIAEFFNGLDVQPKTTAWRPTQLTMERAGRLLSELGYERDARPAIVAPALTMGPFDVADWRARIDALRNKSVGLPLILLPPRGGLQQFSLLAGNGLFVRAPDLALRAALISGARCVVSDEPWACRIARDSGIPLTDVRNKATG